MKNVIYFDENFILPKSDCLCVIRYVEDEGMARGSEEMQHMEQGVMITGACAREEREAGARGDHQGRKESEEIQNGLSGLSRPDNPAPSENQYFGARCARLRTPTGLSQ